MLWLLPSQQIILPHLFSHSTLSLLGSNYVRGSALELSAIESELFLNMARTYLIFAELLTRFPSGCHAADHFYHLYAQLLPSTLSSSSTLAKLLALAQLFEQPNWLATLTHLFTSNPSYSGVALVGLIVQSQKSVRLSCLSAP
jgi:hypothetical protein